LAWSGLGTGLHGLSDDVTLIAALAVLDLTPANAALDLAPIASTGAALEVES
jgi:hypothetical protein